MNEVKLIDHGMVNGEAVREYLLNEGFTRRLSTQLMYILSRCYADNVARIINEPDAEFLKHREVGMKNLNAFHRIQRKLKIELAEQSSTPTTDATEKSPQELLCEYERWICKQGSEWNIRGDVSVMFFLAARLSGWKPF